MSNINRVTLTANLTADPELKEFDGGGAVCEFRIAVNGGYTNRSTDQFVETVSYFDVKVKNGQAKSCKQYLAKGRPVAIDGRLEQERWETPDGNRSKVVIVAQRVQFIGSPNGGAVDAEAVATAPAAAQQSGGELTPDAADDDIPF